MTEKIISNNNMNKRSLSELTKSQLINLLLKQNAEIKKLLQKNMKPQPKNDDNIQPRRTIPTPRKSVKQMVQEYEDKIILPPLEFRDDYKPIPKPRPKKPVPLPKTKIKQVAKVLKGYTKSFEIGIKKTARATTKHKKGH